ncbi:MAG: 2-C-methyl-D-erythritol 4-phosphate cytidylyltransferase [Epulopiscium sp. Nuni2H_MBin001]|nr:MAG: 2-C-methyl-D-erythritol 4-phosphate cytidylyltransferase [Epulopiscium sp. Nuni2H_MBin001]
MVYAEILAGGTGSRMGNTEVPKQFMKLGSKPIIIHTIEQFVVHDKIDQIIVVVPKAWINNTKDLIKKYIYQAEYIAVIEGGPTRNESLVNGIEWIEQNNGINDEDIIVTHDAVRPFLSYRIIADNITAAQQYGAADTVIPAVDTIVMSKNNSEIFEIPIRGHMYQGQTPQSFNIKLFKQTYLKLTETEKEILTDAAKIMVIKDKVVKLVFGESYNIKVTTSYDLILANSILENLL